MTLPASDAEGSYASPGGCPKQGGAACCTPDPSRTPPDVSVETLLLLRAVDGDSSC